MGLEILTLLLCQFLPRVLPSHVCRYNTADRIVSDTKRGTAAADGKSRDLPLRQKFILSVTGNHRKWPHQEKCQWLRPRVLGFSDYSIRSCRAHYYYYIIMLIIKGRGGVISPDPSWNCWSWNKGFTYSAKQEQAARFCCSTIQNARQTIRSKHYHSFKYIYSASYSPKPGAHMREVER